MLGNTSAAVTSAFLYESRFTNSEQSISKPIYFVNATTSISFDPLFSPCDLDFTHFMFENF